MPITRVTTDSEVAALARGLLDSARDRPWCVVSVPAGRAEPLFDVDDVFTQVGDVCPVFVIETGDLSRGLEQLLPARCQVYGGAARVYPVDPGWQTVPEQSPLRFLSNPALATTMTELLIADGLGMANAAGLFEQSAPSAVPARGVVRALIADGARAMVALDDGTLATISQELTFADIPLDWVVSVGQHVEGMFDPVTKRLAPTVSNPSPAELLMLFPKVTLALVLSVERQSAVLAVHPAVPITVSRADVSSNPHDRVDMLLDAGDVVPVRVVRDERGRTALRLSDIDDDDEVEQALALLEGGEPWLLPSRDLVPAEQVVEPVETLPVVQPVATAPVVERGAPAPARPGPGPRAAIAADAAAGRGRGALQTAQLSLEQARTRIRELEAAIRDNGGDHVGDEVRSLRLELGEVHAGNAALRHRLRDLQENQREQRKLLRKSRQGENLSATRRSRFATSDDWMRHELHLAWIDRIDHDERQQWSLPERVDFDERFTPSIEALDAASRAKALKACVDVLTGRARSIHARHVHPLREGIGAEERPVVRSSDGARLLRVAIEQNVPSARRLHYWQLEGGGIELARVVVHDEVGV